jgi:hypothetical protein
MIRLVDILKDDCTSCRSKRLYEAYSEKAIQGFLDKFKEEADDLNINIDEKEIKTLIKIFDRTKEGLPGDKRDLTKWKLPELMRFATKGAAGKKLGDEGEEIEITPDVVYHNDDNSIAIYNGSTEGNCVKFGKGEKWCITRSSFPNYRYSESRGNPTFYLARNTNLPDSNKLSFVAIQVRDPKRTSDSARYVYTNRENSPHESNSMSLEKLKSEVPWLKEIPNLQSILKYIPISSAEKVASQYKSNPLPFKEWAKLPYATKEQYLVVRGYNSDESRRLFEDISNEKFVSTYLKNYPDLLKFIAETPGVIKPELLLQNLSNFPDSARKSIIANLGDGIETDELGSSEISFDVKKLLVKLKKWKLQPNERIYVTDDGSTIVKLKLGDNIKMGLYQAEDDFPDVKINKRTSKYLVDYPELTKLPFSNLVDLSEQGILDKEVVEKVIVDAKKDPNSAIVVKDTEDGQVIIDSSNLQPYKFKNGQLSKASFENPEVEDALRSSAESEEFKKNAVNIAARTEDDLPDKINFNALASIVDSLPMNQRVMPVVMRRGYDPQNGFVFADRSEGNPTILFMKANPGNGAEYFDVLKSVRRGDTRANRTLEASQVPAYFEILRAKGKQFDDNELLSIMKNVGSYGSLIRKFATSNPPVDPDNVYKTVYDEGNQTVYLLNTANRRDSRKVSPSGNLVNAMLSQGRYDQLAGIQRQQTPQQTPQQAQAQQGQQPARTYYQQPAPTGDVNIANTMTALGAGNQFARIPDRDRRRLNITNGAPLNVRVDGGARRRNQLLAGAGQVTQAYAALTSRIYVIRLANGTNVISIKVYPGNREYLLIPGARAYEVHEPDQLLTLLRQNNLAEVRRYLVNSYIDTNPTNLEEFKNLLRQHLNK